jgi:antitoxin HigA-1
MDDKGEPVGRPGFRPSHPGKLVRDALRALGVTQDQLAGRIGVSRQTINSIVSGASAITADVAVRLDKALGISAGLLMRMQAARDTWDAEGSAPVQEIVPFAAPAGSRGQRLGSRKKSAKSLVTRTKRLAVRSSAAR